MSIVGVDIGIRNLAIAIYSDNKIKSMHVFDITEGHNFKNVNKVHVEVLINCLINCFSTRIKPILMEVQPLETILIEKQMSKSTKLTSIMWSFYTMCKCFCENTILQSSYKKNDIIMFQKGRSYAETKMCSVNYVKNLMTTMPSMWSDIALETFLKSKKKDDLGDACLHIFSYMKCHKIGPEDLNTKL